MSSDLPTNGNNRSDSNGVNGVNDGNDGNDSTDVGGGDSQRENMNIIIQNVFHDYNAVHLDTVNNILQNTFTFNGFAAGGGADIRHVTGHRRGRVVGSEEVQQEEQIIFDSMNEVQPYIKVLSDEGKELLTEVAYLPEELRENGVNISEDLDGTCPISQEEFEEGEMVTLLPCGHLFSEDGIMHWFNISHKCPMCRHELPFEEKRNPDYTFHRNNDEIIDNLGMNTDISGNIFDVVDFVNGDGEDDFVVRASPIFDDENEGDGNMDESDNEHIESEDTDDDIDNEVESELDIGENQIVHNQVLPPIQHPQLDMNGLLQIAIDRRIAQEDELNMQLAIMESLYMEQQHQNELNEISTHDFNDVDDDIQNSIGGDDISTIEFYDGD
jgi:hypothetical protein